MLDFDVIFGIRYVVIIGFSRNVARQVELSVCQHKLWDDIFHSDSDSLRKLLVQFQRITANSQEVDKHQLESRVLGIELSAG